MMCGRRRVCGVVGCLAAGLANLALALAVTPPEAAGVTQGGLVELPQIPGDDFLANGTPGEEQAELVPNYLPEIGLLTVGAVTRPVQAPLVTQNPLFSEDVELPGGEPLLEVSLFNWPEAGHPGIVSCKVESEANGQRQELLTETVMGGDRWITRQLDVSRWAGSRIRLTVTATSVDGSEFRVFVSLAGPYVRRSEGDLNLIIICLDALRADHLGCYGYGRDTSPFIDQFARRGVRFARCNSQAPWTIPSLWSVFTGLYPSASCEGQWPDKWRFNANAQTLARVLADHGYRTMAVTGGGSTAPESGLATGFGAYETVGGLGNIPEVYARAVEWLGAHQREKFFLFLHTYEIHEPYTRRAFMDDESDLIGEAVRNYDSGIRFADSYLKELVGMLEASGLQDDTVVVVLADHGEDFREVRETERGPVGFHGQCLLQTVLHVPLILVGPGLPKGRVIEERVELMDVMPTVVELLGLSAPEGIQASSLVGRVSGHLPPVEDEVIFSEGLALGPERKGLLCGDWKVAYCPSPDAEPVGERSPWQSSRERWYWQLPPQELYNLKSDPEEKADLFRDRPQVASRMLAKLRLVMADIKRIRQRNEAGFRQSERESASAETLRQLKQLGYTQ